ncbi:MAG: FAD-dependent oxidoreductase [Candidatus Micrarchaeia archaeon]
MIGILGAGLTGLSAAFHAGTNHLVLEKGREVGGMARSFSFRGCMFDCGPHAFFTGNKRVLSLISPLLKPNYLLAHARRAFIFFRDRLIGYPFEANLYALPKEVMEACLEGAKNRPDAKPKNFREWLLASFGEGIARHYLIPYNEKLWKCPADRMSSSWVVGRVPAPSLTDILASARGGLRKKFGANARFRYPVRGGISAIPAALSSRARVKLASEVVEIRSGASGVTVRLSGGRKYIFSSLISTLPLPELVRLLPDATTEAERAAACLAFNSLACVNIVVKNARFDHHWIYFPDRSFPFHRVSFPSNFSPYNAPKGLSSMMVEFTYRNDGMSDAEYISAAIDGLRRAGLLPKNSQPMASVMRSKYAYVIPTPEGERAAAFLRDFMRERKIITAGRYGAWEYLNMDHCILAGERAAEEARHIA